MIKQEIKDYKVWAHLFKTESEGKSCSGGSDSLRPHELYSPWNSPGQNTGVGSLSLLQEIFPTQGLSSGLPHCRFFTSWATREVIENWAHLEIFRNLNIQKLLQDGDFLV